MIAKKQTMKFLTGDKAVKERFSAFYEDVLSYEDVRKSFA